MFFLQKVSRVGCVALLELIRTSFLRLRVERHVFVRLKRETWVSVRVERVQEDTWVSGPRETRGCPVEERHVVVRLKRDTWLSVRVETRGWCPRQLASSRLVKTSFVFFNQIIKCFKFFY